MATRTKSEEADGFIPPKTSLGARLAALIFLGVLAWMGWAFGSDGATYVQIARDAPTFVATEGKITTASVRQESQNHLPDIRFEYTVAGKLYKGSNHQSAESFKDAKLASRELQRYKVDAPIQVYVNPKDPTQATLSRELPMTAGLIRLFYATISFGVMIFSIFVFIRVGKRTRALARSKYLLEQERIKRHAKVKGQTQPA